MSCKICGSGVTPRQIGKDGHLYHFCPACRFIFKDPSLYLSPGEEKQRYLAHNNTRANRGYTDFLENFITRGVEPFLSPGTRVLDFGSGPEPVLRELLEERGYRTTAWDPYFAPTEPGGSFDAVTLVEVAEHLRQPLEIFRDLSCRLVPGGLIALRTLFAPRNLQDFAGWWYRQDATHVGFFSPCTLERLAGELGLEILFQDGECLCVLRAGQD